jgi:hypothetical protein
MYSLRFILIDFNMEYLKFNNVHARSTNILSLHERKSFSQTFPNLEVMTRIQAYPNKHHMVDRDILRQWTKMEQTWTLTLLPKYLGSEDMKDLKS